MKSAIFCGASAAVAICSCSIACTATRFTFGNFVESVPAAIERSTESLAAGNE
jgi:hypothetical protein